MIMSWAEPVLPSRTLTRARLLTAVWLFSSVLSVVLLPLVGIGREGATILRVSGVVGVVVFFVAQVLVMWSAVTPWTTIRTHRRRQLLFVAAAALSVPLVGPVAADQWATWAWLGASVIGTAPLMWSWSWAAVASLAALVTSAVVAVMFNGDAFQYAVVTLGVGAGLALVNRAPVWLWELLVRAEATQKVEARAAAADERNRFGRDVHDILGHDLTVIALKAELAARTAEADPASSAREAEEVRAIAESALGRLRRALAPRQQDLDVRSEVDQMARILAAAGLHTDVEASDVDASAPALRALPMAVKEATTNVLRHSDAQRCRIVLRSDGDRVRLEVTNDRPCPGRSPQGPTRSGSESSGSASSRPGHSSSGLAGLRERVAGVGGTVAVHRGADSFTIDVSVPAGVPDEELAAHG